MRLKRFIIAFAVLSAIATTWPSDTAAQFENCYAFCLDTCANPLYVKGEWQQQYDLWANWCSLDSTCDYCPLELTGEASVQHITGVLTSASSDLVFTTGAQEFRDRLLLSRDRALVVVKGGCDGNTPVSVVQLDPRRAEILVRLGVTSLEEHFEERFTDATH